MPTSPSAPPTSLSFSERFGMGAQNALELLRVGRFADPIGMSFGATQGYEVPLRDRRIKVESLSLPPELLAPRLPGAGVPKPKPE